jgi:hypothetical protein
MSGKTRWLLIVGIVVVVLLIVVVVTPFLIDVNRFRPEIEQAIGGKIGRTVQIGNLHASLLSGSVEADQITIADDPAFSHEPFLTAKSLKVGVEMKPLIFSKALIVHSLTIDAPEIELLRTPAGRWNFSSLGGTSTAPASTSSSSSVSSFTLDKMDIHNGEIILGRVGAGGNAEGKNSAYKSVEIHAEGFSETAQFPFTFSAKTPGGGKTNLTAQIGPIGNNDAEHMPFSGKMKAEGVPAADIENMLAVLGYALPEGSSLQGGSLNADVTITGPLERMVIAGPVQLSDVKLAGYSLASKLGSALGGSAGGNDTEVQKASSTVRYGSDGLRADNIDVEAQVIGSVTGAGTVAADNALDFNLKAKLNASSPLGAISKLPIFGTDGAIAFRVTGTTSRPQVVPELGGLGKTPVGNVGSALGQLFKKKQK